MKSFKRKNLPVAEIRRYLEPGPVVLVSSTWKGETDIMTMGWYTVMEFSPSLVGCVISSANHSFGLIRESKECVINIPTAKMINTVIGIGNSSGDKVDKFKKFKLTATQGKHVSAPMIGECYANLECRLHNTQLIDQYNFFIFEVVHAQISPSPTYPKTLHYRGNGVFMISGKSENHKKQFKPEKL